MIYTSFDDGFTFKDRTSDLVRSASRIVNNEKQVKFF